MTASGTAARGGGQTQPMLGMGRIKGEWMDIRLPDSLTGAPLAAVAKHLPLPPKLLSKLMQNRGCLLQGANLRLHLFPRESRDYPSDWMELNILYEDEFTLVVNKPAGIEVHPSEKGQRKTLAHAVAAYYEMTGQDLRIRHVHRIDKDTTGPVLYAKNEFAQYQYDKGMREKTIGRVYVALAEGGVEGNKGRIDKPIGQDRHHSTRRRVSETGDPAVTHYEVVERFADHTLVRLHLETGRTHQIRVHLSSINHPLAGDGLYGGKRGIISRQALHGERLIWRHPWTGEKQQVTAPLPDDFREALDKLRRAKQN
ncbi:RluA family pseudouridine synthase [Cohnella cellulosilytica]